MQPDYLTATEAAEALGVSLQTLYVYVGRKGIRTQPVPGTREKRYWRADVERVRRREPPPGDATQWTPDQSQLTLITPAALFYRGRDAVELANTHSFEAVAALLWGLAEEAAFQAPPPAPPAPLAPLNALLAEQAEMTRYAAAFPLLEEADPRAHDLSRAGMARTGAGVLRWMTALLTFSPMPSMEPIHLAIGRGLKLREEEADLVRRLLVLAADHGFEPGAMAVRALAACGVSPWRAVLGGLATTLGRRSKLGNLLACSRLLSEIEAARDPATPVAVRLQEGEALPGFGSHLYAGGDPRARALLDQAHRVYAKDERFHRISAAFDFGCTASGLEPGFGLSCVVVARLIGLAPRHTLFNLGRAAGWIAHAIEQHALGEWTHLDGVYRGPLPTPDGP